MFSSGAFIKVWDVVNKGNYTEVNCSSSKKNNQTGNYETDFSNKFVRFVGNAHKKNPQQGEKIKITNCGVQNVYEKNGQREYLKNPTYIVFDFERDGESGQPRVAVPQYNPYTPNAYGGNTENFEPIDIADDNTLPF